MKINRNRTLIIVTIFCTMIFFDYVVAQSSFANYNHWIVDGSANTITNDTNFIYLGGNFTYTGPPTGSISKITSTSTIPDLTYCRPNGQIIAAISDGMGGWYIGGDFNAITTSSTTTVTRNNIAHIFSDGQLDMTWDPNPNSYVIVLTLSGSDLYVGGGFTSIGGQNRNKIAKLSTNGVGAADLTWNPNANSDVYSIIVSNNEIYVAGVFSSIGGQVRNRIAKLSASGSGIADALWNPNPNNNVAALALSGSDLYVGGGFTNIGGQNRNNIAKLTTVGTGSVDLVWNPNANGNVNAIVVQGNEIFVGGSFFNIGGQVRYYIAKLSASGTGLADVAWNPNPNGVVGPLVYSGGDLYVGGDFTSISGQSRNRIAKLNTNTGALLAWDPNASDIVRSIAISGNDIILGGDFASTGGFNRNRIARFSKVTGEADISWDPNANGNVNAIILDGNDVFIAGAFTNVGGQTRNRIAKLSAIGTGSVDIDWNPNILGNNVNAIAISNGNLFIGGDFNVVGGVSRLRIAKISTLGTGLVDLNWYSGGAGNVVESMKIVGDDLYVGGEFTSIAGQVINYLAKLTTLGTGSADLTWNPNPNGRVKTILINGNDMFVGGSFSIIDGQSRSFIAKISPIGTGNVDPIWNPVANNGINAIAISGNEIYVGGFFSSIGGQPRNRIAKLSTTSTGIVDANWNPNSNAIVRSINIADGNVYAVGDFTKIGGLEPRIGIALFGDLCSLPINPIISIVNASLCVGSNATLSISNGSLSSANNWQWYDGSCGIGSVGTGTAIIVSPTITTTYYVRGEGGCVGVAANCSTIEVHVNVQPTITVNSGTICSGNSFTIVPTGANTYTIEGGNSIVSPISSTSYTVIGESAEGCLSANTATCEVIVNASPAIAVNNGTICSGESFTIIPSGANTYTIEGGTDVVSPLTNTTYSIQGQSSNGCDAIAISSVQVNQSPILNVSTTNSVCQGSSILLQVSGANTYSWSNGANTATTSVMPITSTIYSVTGINNNNNCSSTETISVSVDNTCQDVWPGDVNSDGVANNLDVLELGLHFNHTGPQRAVVSNNWQSYYSNNWVGTISNGKNLNHSDCNGDGTINNDDTLAIYNNYGLVHDFKINQNYNSNSQIKIIPTESTLAAGTWGSASIYLGDASTPISNVNGLAFTINYDNNLIEPNQIYLEYQNSFIDVGQNLKFRKTDFANNKLYAATTHTTNNNVSGYGLIAKLHYQLKSSLTNDEILNIGITEAYQSDASGTIVSLTSGTSSVQAVATDVGVQEFNSNVVFVSPNPTSGDLIINSKSQLQKIEIVTITGQLLLTETPTHAIHKINLEDFTNGIYFINVYQNNQVIKREKVVLTK